MDKSLAVFEKYCRSEATKFNYQYQFSKFMEWCKSNVDKLITADGLLILKEGAIQVIVEDYVMHLRRRYKPSSVSSIIAGLMLFFSMNDKVLNWDKVKKMIPEHVKKAGYDAYRRDDIQKILEKTGSLRNKALVLFLASTGCRVGAIPSLEIKHLKNVSDGCKSVAFYDGSKDEYIGFLTPESSKALDSYLEERRKSGEYLDEDSPIFRRSYKIGIGKVKPQSSHSIQQLLHHLVRNVERKKVDRRYNVSTLHGFRKFFNTTLKNNREINIAIAEKLMGHTTKLIPLDSTYHVPNKDILFAEFRKAIGDLTIDDSEREHARAEIAEKKITELESEKDKVIAKQAEDILELKKAVEGIFELMKKD